MVSKYRLKALIASFAIVFLVASIGSIFTSKSVNSPWYNSIKPAITPPNYVFPVVWTVLFILIALSLFFSWSESKNKDKGKIAAIFAINLILNALWSLLYFGLKNPLLAFIEMIFLWLSIIAMILALLKISKKSAYMLIPYLLWVSFAAVLNFLSI
jgi:tryptophan-rich sensory protein